jgi:hypothetical protein
MKSFIFCTALFASSVTLLSSQAHAQDLDLDGSGEKEKKKKKKKRTRTVEFERDVREITRGFFAKSNIGGAFYLGGLGGAVQPGTLLSLSGGKDFIDRKNMSMSWEATFAQGVHNGLYYEDQVDIGPFIQGDLRTYSFMGTVEWSFYPSRRIGLGLRAGGGIMLSPLLMDETYYNEEVVAKAWGGNQGPYHSSPHPLGMGGPTFEYYTKLAHFSVGIDVDIIYAVGFDLGAVTSGYLKYTF